MNRRLFLPFLMTAIGAASGWAQARNVILFTADGAWDLRAERRQHLRIRQTPGAIRARHALSGAERHIDSKRVDCGFALGLDRLGDRCQNR